MLIMRALSHEPKRPLLSTIILGAKYCTEDSVTFPLIALMRALLAVTFLLHVRSEACRSHCQTKTRHRLPNLSLSGRAGTCIPKCRCGITRSGHIDTPIPLSGENMAQNPHFLPLWPGRYYRQWCDFISLCGRPLPTTQRPTVLI